MKPKKRRRAGGSVSRINLKDVAAAQPATQVLLPFESCGGVKHWVMLAIPVLLTVLYAYWPTFLWMEDAWRNEPDYSHGYLVPFLTLMLLVHRGDMFPGIRPSVSYKGISLIVLAILMRFAGRFLYMDFLDAYSLLPLIAGVVWTLLGSAALKWSLPAIGFLFFMIPLPYQAESLLSWKLQGVATSLSTVFLRVLGQPAVSEGHVIWIADQRLLVEQACSGMRIFIGVAALAYFWAVMVKRTWVDRVVLLASVIPLAVFVNAIRITVVGLLYQWVSGEQYRHGIHDWSGYLMIPTAFALLWGVKKFWENLYGPVEHLTARDFVKSTG
ncbi:Transmembrane exosortase [Rubripirellula tenax]|uniref:Transmembrane exosortase n=1 Tax=Rubripirellula tenax TaxID=2528015 RepID=A0A5C6F352_9BACT|nr:exosortase/archaeosortase family protein [Rubripirellula tenax]TWU54476.1 Transmembrane exosortase [Rubripirellula tenax]